MTDFVNCLGTSKSQVLAALLISTGRAWRRVVVDLVDLGQLEGHPCVAKPAPNLLTGRVEGGCWLFWPQRGMCPSCPVCSSGNPKVPLAGSPPLKLVFNRREELKPPLFLLVQPADFFWPRERKVHGLGDVLCTERALTGDVKVRRQNVAHLTHWAQKNSSLFIRLFFYRRLLEKFLVVLSIG